MDSDLKTFHTACGNSRSRAQCCVLFQKHPAPCSGKAVARQEGMCCVPIGCSPFPHSVSWKLPDKPTNE